MHAAMRIAGTRWTGLLLLALVLPCAACASRFALRATPAAAELGWPPAPLKAKVTYVRSLTGIAETRGAGARLKAIVTGTDQDDPNAFALPVAVATGADGRLAVADTGRKCVHLYVPQAQRYVRLTGPPAAPLVAPVGVAFDDALHLYVTDSSGRLVAYGPQGEPLFTRTSAGSEKLLRPTGIAYSPRTKRLYVVDTAAGKVHAFTTSGEHALSFGGRGEGAEAFNFPTSIAWAAGELAITDSLNFRIAIYDENGTPRGAFGRHGDGSGDLALPKGVAMDRDGVVYVADGLLDNVQLFDRTGRYLVTVGRRGTGDGEFWLPAGMFISDGGELYVCDTYNRRIQVFRITERYAQTAP